MNTTMIISLLALAAALAALVATFSFRLGREPVQIEISRSTQLDAEGKERVSYSFTHGHPKTVLDRFRIARARRRFDRLSRDGRNGARSAEQRG